ncbi:MAG: response regulator [Flavobacteriales bacterium]
MDHFFLHTKKTVIVIDDDDILLDSYQYYINSFKDFILKGSYTNVNEALECYDDIYPDIIISDISMPGINGIKGIEKFKALDEDVKIIMISVHDDFSSIKGSLINRADGYLTKPVNKIDLLKALQDVCQDKAPLSSDVAKKIIRVFQTKKLSIFSERENQILHYYTKGYTYKAIADKIFVTPSTVNFHIQNIYEKLNVSSKSEALKVLSSLNYFE